MARIPITALEELVKTNLILSIGNPTKIFKVGEVGGETTIVGPGDGSVMSFYFANKKSYQDKNLYFINDESDINMDKEGYISFHFNGHNYEIHRTEETMPKSIEYVKFSKEGYIKRWVELSPQKREQDLG